MSTDAAVMTKSSSMSPLILGCIAATWLIWGSTYLTIRFALEGFPPFYLMATRFIVAGGALLIWQLSRGERMPTYREWFHATVIGSMMLGCGMGGTAYAEQTIASGLVVACIAVTPLLLVLINLFFGVRPRRAEVPAVVVGLAGVIMLTRGAGIHASPTGLMAVALACCGWSLGSILSQRGLKLAAGATGFASEMLCGGVALLLVSALAGESWHLPTQAGPWLAWSYLVIAGSLIAFSAYMLLLARTRASLASSYTLVNPLVALLLGVSLGHEVVTAWEWASVCVVMIGVALLFAGRRVAD